MTCAHCKRAPQGEASDWLALYRWTGHDYALEGFACPECKVIDEAAYGGIKTDQEVEEEIKARAR